MFERRFLLPAGLASIGVFIVYAVFLPSPSSFGYNGLVDYIFKSRRGWGEAGFVALGTLLFLLGIGGFARALSDRDGT